MVNAARVSLALLALAGCTTTSAIRPDEIGRLDGYDMQTSPQPRQIETIGGQKITFDGEAALYIDLAAGSQGGRFAAIHARDQTFEGRTTSGHEVRASILDIRSARIEKPNRAPVVAGVLSALALAGILLLIFMDKGQQQAVSRRPLRIESKIVVASARAASANFGSEGWEYEGGGPDTTHLSSEIRAALADAWTTTATFEHASVPAFARLSLTLVALGAPARLIKATHRAALDEVRHARLAFGLAAAYAGKPVAPGPLSDLHRASAVMADTLADLAAETVVDGCLGEGVSAAAAEEAGRRAADPVVRATLEMMAADEAAHAELAWDVVRWCCVNGGTEVSSRLDALVEKAPPIAGSSLPPHLERELEAHGQLRASVWRRLDAEVRTNVVARLKADRARRPSDR